MKNTGKTYSPQGNVGFVRNAAFNTLTNLVYNINRYEEIVRLGN